MPLLFSYLNNDQYLVNLSCHLEVIVFLCVALLEAVFQLRCSFVFVTTLFIFHVGLIIKKCIRFYVPKTNLHNIHIFLRKSTLDRRKDVGFEVKWQSILKDSNFSLTVQHLLFHFTLLVDFGFMLVIVFPNTANITASTFTVNEFNSYHMTRK